MILEQRTLDKAKSIADRINGGQDYVCFGAGRYFYDFINTICIQKKLLKLPKYVCDNNQSLWGRKVCGVEVAAPERLLEEEPDKTVVVMSAVSPFGIMADLQSIRLQRHYFYMIPLNQLETYFYFTAHSEEIEEVYGSLADEASKERYRNFWLLSLEGIMNFSPIYSANAYWNNDIVPRLKDGWEVLYAGAFDGKHIDRALKSNENIVFHGFEPNRKMYEGLEAKYAARKNVRLYPYALDNKKEVLEFDPNVLLGAMVIREGDKGGKRVDSRLEKVNCSTMDAEIARGGGKIEPYSA